MARMIMPLVEVTAPDGTSSLWAAISIPYKDAVAAVKTWIPAGHSANSLFEKFRLD